MGRTIMERFTGLTLAINPIFNVISLLYLSIFKTAGLGRKLKTDRANLIFWLLLALSGLVSVYFAVNRAVAIPSYFIPFVFIWLYILGRWTIDNPRRFFQDFLRGTAFLGAIAAVASTFHLKWYIGNVQILDQFWLTGRGAILYVTDNSLGLLFQAGVVGAIGSLLIFREKKWHIFENIIILIFCTWGLVISGSRGAIIAVFIGLLYLLTQFRIKAFLGAGIAVALAVMITSRRFLTLFDMAGHSVRIKIWLSSLRIVKDNLLFGVGPGNFGEVFERYRPAELVGKAVSCSHSNYLNVFVGWGIFGGIFFWGWQLFLFVRAIVRGLKPLQRIIIAVLIAFYAHVLINELFAAYAGFLLGLMDHPSFSEKESA